MKIHSYEIFFKKYLYPFYEQTVCRRLTFKYCEEYEKNQWLSSEEIKIIQFVKLKNLLQHAYEYVPYYKNQWEKIGIMPNDIRTIDDYQRLPYLSKQDVKDNYNELIARNYLGRTRCKTTGGSTGVPMRYEYNNESNQRRHAVMWRGYRWAGAEMGRKALYLWGSAGCEKGKLKALKTLKDGCYNFLLRRKILDSFKLSEKNILEYINKIDRYRPINLVGYVMPLIVLAKYIKENSLEIEKPTSVITGAESLHEFQRVLLEEVFNCPVFNTYGCREFMLIASECEKRKGLHINADHLLVETMDEYGGYVFDQPGKVVITDLHNYGMPLIKYLNGDIAELSNSICDCGRGLPMMSSIRGRELDIIRTSDGRIVPGEYFPHLMKEIVTIQEYQVVQKKIDELDIYIAPKSGLLKAEEQFLLKETRKILGERIRINIIYIDRVERTDTGKYRVTVSYLEKL